MIDLTGKAAIVSGAGSGIGRASAITLAKAGAKVLVTDINQDSANRVADEIRNAGGIAEALVCDISSEVQIEAAVAACAEKFGSVDLLHNNAALMRPDVLARDGGVSEMASDLWDEVMQTNVRGCMLFSKHAIRAMLATGGGAIVNTASINGIVADSYLTAYGVSKAAIISLTQHIAAAYGKSGIRCNAVAPSLILTDNVREGMADVVPFHLKETLTPELGTPQQVANVVAFLLSPIGDYINGTVIAVDGGTLAHVPTLVGGNDFRASFASDTAS